MNKKEGASCITTHLHILDLVTCFDNRGFTKHYNAKIVIIG